MTRKTIDSDITTVRDTGKLYIHSPYRLDQKVIKDSILNILSEFSGSSKEVLDVFTSPEIKLQILQWFWVDDFNYLGTRIRLRADKNFIASFKNRYEILFYFEGNPVGYLRSEV